MFLSRGIFTCFPGHFDPFLNHVKQIPQILISISQSLDMIPHPNDQNRTASLIETTKPIFSWRMYLRQDLLFLRNLIRFIFLIPLDPIPPHLNNFLLLELSGNTKSGNSMNFSVETFLFSNVTILFLEDIDHFLLVGLHLSQLAIGNFERIKGSWTFHCCSL